ncbi:MAG: DUF6544 family protein [Calditrichaceae bacterium]
MSNFIFSFIVIVHALIHLLGFAKAYNFGSIQQLTKVISKPMGMIWLFTFLLFVITVLLFWMNKNMWPALAIISVIFSQILILTVWSDAKFGTVANIIVLAAALPALGNIQFNNMIEKEQKELLGSVAMDAGTIVDSTGINHLPVIIQKWFKFSGVINKPKAVFVRLKQQGEMKTKPDGKWMSFKADEYFDARKPSFIWVTRVWMMPLIYLNGRDKFKEGEGEMLIRLLSLVNVVNEGHNEKMNTGAMLRYLGEVCWFPSAAINDYMNWEEIDSLSAKAIMTYKNRSVSGVFTFKDNGEMVSFQADRYFGGGADAKLEKWLVEMVEYKEFDGYRIPNKCKVIWKLNEGDFTWLDLEIVDLDINTFQLYE